MGVRTTYWRILSRRLILSFAERFQIKNSARKTAASGVLLIRKIIGKLVIGGRNSDFNICARVVKLQLLLPHFL